MMKLQVVEIVTDEVQGDVEGVVGEPLEWEKAYQLRDECQGVSLREWGDTLSKRRFAVRTVELLVGEKPEI